MGTKRSSKNNRQEKESSEDLNGEYIAIEKVSTLLILVL